jgi:hypothetical protein
LECEKRIKAQDRKDPRRCNGTNGIRKKKDRKEWSAILREAKAKLKGP